MVHDSKPLSQDGSRTLRIQAPAAAGGDGDARPSLLVVQGTEADLGRFVPCDRSVIIGRDPSADLALHDGSISREHCRVEPESGGGCALVDLGSTNGTDLNHVRVRGRQPLEHGDKIFLGVSVVRFALVDALEFEYHTRLEDMASTDPVTGLFSRRRYEALFDLASREAVEAGEPLSVIVVDVDDLKEINDSRGHEMGAFTIAETARVLRARLEARGLLSRHGGDEIVACFPGADKRDALALAEAARAAIEDARFTRGAHTADPTVSIGVASFPEDTGDPADLFEVADGALYRAKREGKNRVVAADRGDVPRGRDSR